MTQLMDLNQTPFEMLDGYQKTALFLYLIGHEKSNELMTSFDLKDMKVIRGIVLKLAPVRRELAVRTLQHFLEESEQIAVSESPQEYSRMLSENKSMANSLLDEGIIAENVRGLEELKTQSPEAIYSMLLGCHPQMIVAVLAYLDDQKSADVLEIFPLKTRNELIKSITDMETIKPMALKDLSLMLDRQTASEDGGSGSMNIGGPKAAANILNQLTPGNDEAALAYIESIDKNQADEIRDKMFMFSDLVLLDPQSMMKIVGTVESDVLINALKGDDGTITRHFTDAMSTRQKDRFVEDLDDKGQIKVSEVVEAQKIVINTVRNLHEKGEISIPGKGEAYV
jgi:flagellar motor switch protein FliG